MSTYLAAWAILPDTYGKQVNNDSDSEVYIGLTENFFGGF
jgi:hypothetical protein